VGRFELNTVLEVSKELKSWEYEGLLLVNEYDWALVMSPKSIENPNNSFFIIGYLKF
jgi:hypothetical protein